MPARRSAARLGGEHSSAYLIVSPRPPLTTCSSINLTRKLSPHLFSPLPSFGLSSTSLSRSIRRRWLTLRPAPFSAVWLIYPVAWGLGEGGNVIRPTSEMVFYGILDMCIIVLVVCIFLAMISSVDHSVYGAHRVRPSPFPSLLLQRRRLADVFQLGSAVGRERPGPSLGEGAPRPRVCSHVERDAYVQVGR